MAIKRFESTQDLGIDPLNPDDPMYGYTDPVQGIAPGGPVPGSFNPNPNESGPTTPQPETPQPRTSYDAMAGWDVSKLNRGEGGTNKYQFGRWLQNSPFYNGGSGSGSRGNMQSLVDAYNQATGSNVRSLGEDAVDFGDGNGTIDLINGNTNSWQWTPINTDDGVSSGRRSGNASAGQLGGLFTSLGNASERLSSHALNETEPTDYLIPNAPTSGVRRNSSLSTALEAARMPYEIARKTQMNNARADLANRGLLSEPGHAQGPEATAITQIETGLAPAYTGAINDRLQQMDALGLGELEQNRMWQQFLLDHGLDRDRVRADIMQGNTDQYLQLLQLWLNAAQTSANGYI